MPFGDDEPVARWRHLAADARDAAGELTDPQAKVLLLTIAQAYERLARRAEERKPKKDQDDPNEIASACADVVQGGLDRAQFECSSHMNKPRPFDDPARWRQKADEARRMADQLADPELSRLCGRSPLRTRSWPRSLRRGPSAELARHARLPFGEGGKQGLVRITDAAQRTTDTTACFPDPSALRRGTHSRSRNKTRGSGQSFAAD